MVFAIRFVGGTFYTDWLRALKVEQKCVHALVQELRTLHLAAGGPWQRNDVTGGTQRLAVSTFSLRVSMGSTQLPERVC